MTITFDKLVLKEQFPGVITSNQKDISYDELLNIIKNNHKELVGALKSHGALLFRGMPIRNAKQFSNFITNLGLGSFVNYIGGDSPRDKVDGGVYTSTEAPPSLHIPLHQELSFIKNFPKNIYFYCDTAPQTGGETIIADARQVYKAFDKSFLDKFQNKKLTYISRYYYKSKVMSFVNKLQRSHKSWTEVFETDDKQDVEKKCLQNDFQWRWHKKDWLEIRQTRPAVCEHPDTFDKVWFNQAHLYDFNPRLLGLKRYLGAKIFYYNKSTLMHEIKYADGSCVSRKDLYYILDVLEANTVAFPWQKNDVLVLDNVLAMHGRAPFKGDRRILTALTS